jgi:hypothetical protein
MMRQIESEVNAQWLSKIGYTLKFDERSNEAMTYLSAEEATKVVSIASAKLVTVNEARNMLGLEPVEWGDDEPSSRTESTYENIATVNAGILTVNEAREKLGLPSVSWGNDQPIVPAQVQATSGGTGLPPDPASQAKAVAKDLEEALAKARRLNTWTSINNRIKPVEVRCAKAVRRYFYDVEKRLLGELAKGMVAKDVADPDIDSVFDDEELNKIVTKYLEQSIAVGYSTMGIGDVNISDPGVNQYLGSRVEYMKGVNDTAKEALKEKLHAVLVDAMEQQMTEAQRTAAIEAMIREDFASLKSHARTIARTEVHGAMAEGRWEACQELNPTEVEWVSSRDMLVRDSHQHLDGQRVPFGERFENGCQYPLDPAGGPEEVCNCRCTFQVHY